MFLEVTMSKIDPSLIKELRERSGGGFLDCKKALEACEGDLEKARQWLVEKGKASAQNRAQRLASEGVVASKITKTGVGVIIEVNCETDFVAKNQDFLATTTEVLHRLVEDLENTNALEISNQTLDEVNELLIAFSAKTGEKISLRRFQLLAPAANEYLVDYTHTNKRFGVLLKVKGQHTPKTYEAARGVAMHAGALNPKYALRIHVESEAVDRLVAQAKQSPSLVNKPLQIQEKILSGLLQKAFSEFVLEDQSFAMEPSFSVKEFLAQHSLEIVEFIRFEVAEGIEKKQSDFASEVRQQIKVE